MSILFPSDDVVEVLACLGRYGSRTAIGFGGGIAKGNQGYRLDFGGQAQSIACGFDIEAAHPAGAKVQRCRRQTDVLDGYG